MIVKICKKHGPLTEEQVQKEKNSQMKLGYQLRCIQCRREKDTKWKLNNLDKHRASSNKKRNEDRKLFREGLISIEPKANIWTREDRKNNQEKYLKREAKSRKKQGQLRNTKEVCRRFELDVDYYYELQKKQDNLCKICGKKETRKSRTVGKICKLAIDHCHLCEDNGYYGKEIIRGLLCHDCNTGIGKFHDNIELLQTAIEYLQSHQHK